MIKKVTIVLAIVLVLAIAGKVLFDNLINAKYYHPKDNKNEKVLKDIMDKLEKL